MYVMVDVCWDYSNAMSAVQLSSGYRLAVQRTDNVMCSPNLFKDMSLITYVPLTLGAPSIDLPHH